MAEDEQSVPAPVRPKTRWGYDDDGNEIQPPAGGLEMDPETGRARIPAAPEPAPAPAKKPPAAPSS